MAGYGFYNYGNTTPNTPVSAVSDTLIGAFNKANLNNTNMRIPSQWGSGALIGAVGKPYQSKWAFNDPSQQIAVVTPTNTSTAMFQHDMMQGVPQFGPQAAAPSLLTNNQSSGWSSMFAPDFFKGVGDTTVTSNIGSRPSVFSNNQQTGTAGTSGITSQTAQQVRRPVVTDTAVVQQQQPPVTVDTQPTSGSSWDMFNQDMFTNVGQTTSPTLHQQQAAPSLWTRGVNAVGEFFGIPSEQQYLRNQDGSLMVDKYGNNIVDPNQRTWTDVGAVAGGLANTAMGAYGMFTGFDQGQQQLDTQRGQLNLMRDKYEEDKRKNQAIVAQNRRA